MIARAGSGWQTVLADLSLILFMVTASAVSEAPAAPEPRPLLPALGEPVALWRQGPDGPALTEWLAVSAADPRLRLTIIAAPQQAQDALGLAARAGRPARLLVEPGASGISAALTYDLAPVLARGLHPAPAKETIR